MNVHVSLVFVTVVVLPSFFHQIAFVSSLTLPGQDVGPLLHQLLKIAQKAGNRSMYCAASMTGIQAYLLMAPFRLE